MEDKEMIKIQNGDGTTAEVELVTYLISEDNTNAYLVYSKGEKTGAENDEIIYISKILSKDNQLKIGDISDDNEWATVQKLLKQIANAN